MKRFISVVLVVVMILTVCATAFADGPFSAKGLKKGANSKTDKIAKESGNGVAAYVYVDKMSSKATYHFRVWMTANWQASEGKRLSGNNKSTSLATLRDGYDNPRLWNGEQYYLVATHSDYSKVNTASTNGTWHP